MKVFDAHYMQLALEQAKIARAAGEVPVGAVVVIGETIIATSHNAPLHTHDPSAHAELRAVRQACKTLCNYRLPDATVYVTLEPCPMCVGALIHARIARCVFGASDPKTGALGGHMDLFQYAWNHRFTVEHGVLAEACGGLLRDFFVEKRLAERGAR